eukprot:TRINITY_DN5409_c0_g1_i3.p2 TRINITY_DN5409_c0_g1~~TRINITY_DN5409_c0_g1_i3.p2  ORF type:complete len:176 (-),score=50.20 TRINITY_DN5409_c0_g1_i3:39-566(-)
MTLCEEMLGVKASRDEVLELIADIPAPDAEPVPNKAALTSSTLAPDPHNGGSMCMSCLRKVNPGEERHHEHKNHEISSIMRRARCNKAHSDKRGAIVKGTVQHEVPSYLLHPGLGRYSGGTASKDLPPLHSQSRATSATLANNPTPVVYEMEETAVSIRRLSCVSSMEKYLAGYR